MKFLYDIPSSFWSLFRSVNREIYMEALLAINEEYQYSNYFLSKESCLLVLTDMCAQRRYQFQKEELEIMEEEQAAMEEEQESLPKRILGWLIRTRWLRRIEDFTTMTTNIVIPDYSAVLIEAIENLVHQPVDETEIYIQNVYATLFSFQNDSRMNLAMLRTALVNTRKLNKALQDMLHNMDKFFERLLEKQTYGELLREHLEGYVEEVVKKKYHILKTSDNFYIYKMDIKRCLKEMRENEEWIQMIRSRQADTRSMQPNTRQSEYYQRRRQDEDVLELIDQIERGFDDIEHRIANMDKEHSKYVRATVSRLNYLLSEDSDRKGMLVQLLNRLSVRDDKEQEERLSLVSEKLHLTALDILAENPLFKRKKKRGFEEDLTREEETKELSKEEILQLNRIQHRFSRKLIEEFVEDRLTDGVWEVEQGQIESDEEFEMLILAYDLGMRHGGRYEVQSLGESVESGRFRYPEMLFIWKE